VAPAPALAMKRATRQRLLVLFLAAALLLLAGWQWQRDARAAPGPLTALAPASVTRIALTLPGARALHYEKRDGHWWRTDGTPVRAIDSRVNELADIAAASALSWRAATDFDPAKIGLLPPQALLVLNTQTLAFGETSVTEPQHYVQVGQRIALVSPRYVPRSPAAQTTALH
jgi:hypothetical protein